MSALLLVSAAVAQEVDGFAEVRVSALAGVDADVPLFAVERFRPTFSAPLGERTLLSTTIEAGLSQGWRATDALPPALADQLGTAHDNTFFAISRAGDYLAVDRLYLDAYLPAADVRVGRQALNWGSAFAVNPSDPFPQVLVTEPWKPRAGVNAARVDIPFGELNNVTLVAGSDDLFQHPRLAARATVNALQADWSVVGAWREEVDEAVAGVDIKGTLGVGYWLEGVVHLPYVAPSEPFEELAAGIDYSLPVLEQLIVTAQYYRNGSGTPRAGQLGFFQERKAFQAAFSGRDYAMAAVSAGVTPDVSASVLWMQNLGDGTAYVVPSLTTVPATNWELSVVAQVPVDTTGEGGEFKPSRQQLSVALPGTDVPLDGLVPDATVILWTRVHF